MRGGALRRGEIDRAGMRLGVGDELRHRLDRQRRRHRDQPDGRVHGRDRREVLERIVGDLLFIAGSITIAELMNSSV